MVVTKNTPLVSDDLFVEEHRPVLLARVPEQDGEIAARVERFRVVVTENSLIRSHDPHAQVDGLVDLACSMKRCR